MQTFNIVSTFILCLDKLYLWTPWCIYDKRWYIHNFSNTIYNNEDLFKIKINWFICMNIIPIYIYLYIICTICTSNWCLNIVNSPLCRYYNNPFVEELSIRCRIIYKTETSSLWAPIIQVLFYVSLNLWTNNVKRTKINTNYTDYLAHLNSRSITWSGNHRERD